MRGFLTDIFLGLVIAKIFIDPFIDIKFHGSSVECVFG